MKTVEDFKKTRDKKSLHKALHRAGGTKADLAKFCHNHGDDCIVPLIFNLDIVPEDNLDKYPAARWYITPRKPNTEWSFQQISELFDRLNLAKSRKATGGRGQNCKCTIAARIKEAEDEISLWAAAGKVKVEGDPRQEKVEAELSYRTGPLPVRKEVGRHSTSRVPRTAKPHTNRPMQRLGRLPPQEEPSALARGSVQSSPPDPQRGQPADQTPYISLESRPGHHNPKRLEQPEGSQANDGEDLPVYF